MKKNVKRAAKVKGSHSTSTIERSGSEVSNSKNIPESTLASENLTSVAEKPWNPCDFYYYQLLHLISDHFYKTLLCVVDLYQHTIEAFCFPILENE